MKKLPPEITDRIVDFLHSDSSALSACSLVCKSWLPGSRHHLFKRLVFSPTHKARPLQGPVDVSVARTIAPYVHQVHIFEDDRLEWVNTVLPHLEITNFKEVKSLLLSSMNYKSDPSAAATLHALRVCFPGVTRLRLDTVFFDTFPRVLELICVFPELEVVHLENVRLRDDRPIVEPLPGQPNPLPHLRSLLLEDYIILSNLWNWCRSYGNLPSVDNLSLVVRKGRVSAIARVLKDLGGALKRLSIGFDFEPTTDEDYAGLDLHCNSELSAVHLLLPCIDGGGGPVALAVQILSIISCPSLRELTFTMDLTTEQLAQKDTWERLDGALSKAAFQALEVIAFRLLDVHGCIYPKGDIEDAVTRIRNWLPGCETHRVIQFYSF